MLLFENSSLPAEEKKEKKKGGGVVVVLELGYGFMIRCEGLGRLAGH